MIGAIAAASEAWQALRGTQSAQPSSTTFPGADASAAKQPASPATGGTVGQLVSDVQSLLLSLQSGGANAPDSATSGATAAGTASTDPLAAVQADLQKLSQGGGPDASAQAGGPRPGHHHHHGTPGNVQTDAAGTNTTLADAPCQDAGSSSTGLAAAIAKAITAYRASAQPGAANAATTA